MEKNILAEALSSARHQPDSTEVQLLLGQIALNKNLFPQAFMLFSVAAQSGQPKALNMLGRAYERGWGVPRSVSRAVDYFEAAAAQQYGWAYFNLGDLYLSEDSLPPDADRAFQYYVQAAQYGVNKALNMLGTLYENGWSNQRADKEKARQYFLAGAQADDCWAAFNLGRLSLEEKDKNTAAFWLESSLAYGFPEYWIFIYHYLLQNPSHVFKNIHAKVTRLLSQSAQHVTG